MNILEESVILYVEDDENIRESIAKALRRRVKKVVTAENGLDGLKKISTI